MRPLVVFCLGLLAPLSLVGIAGCGSEDPIAHYRVPREAPETKAPTQSGNGVTYTTPAGWKAQAASGIRLASLTVGDGDQQAEITVIALGPAAGSLLANINRWRGQIQLPNIAQADLDKLAKPFKLHGHQATFVEMVGETEQINAIIDTAHGRTVFYKIKGAKAVVAKEAESFDAFTRSVQMGGGHE
jgi:hypothetical protein